MESRLDATSLNSISWYFEVGNLWVTVGKFDSDLATVEKVLLLCVGVVVLD